MPPRFRQPARWQLEPSTRSFIHRLHSPSGPEPPLVEGSNLVGTPHLLSSSSYPYSDVDASATDTQRRLTISAFRMSKGITTACRRWRHVRVWDFR